MPLSSGDKLGPYEIVEPLGAGGMGEVYRATDTRLGRDVAIKALPAQFGVDGDRVARFDREARALASLNHPHIAAIHDVEEVDGSRFLVMELVEGESLASRIAREPLSVDETIAIARQIAAGLEAAHGRGILHRDLKPANIMISADGRVKILDFGLATAPEDASDAPLSNSPTTPHATASGVLMGTAGYMSPEQARGKRVDRRADVWAFGAVLWEMLSNRPLFRGESVSDIVASVLRDEPLWSELPATTPAGLLRLLRMCLARDPNRRMRDFGDIALELDNIDSAVAKTPAPSRSSPLPWIAAAVLTIAVALLTWRVVSRQRVAAPLRKTLLVAGAAAGMSATFAAPVAAVLKHDGYGWGARAIAREIDAFNQVCRDEACLSDRCRRLRGLVRAAWP